MLLSSTPTEINAAPSPFIMDLIAAKREKTIPKKAS